MTFTLHTVVSFYVGDAKLHKRSILLAEENEKTYSKNAIIVSVNNILRTGLSCRNPEGIRHVSAEFGNVYHGKYFLFFVF